MRLTTRGLLRSGAVALGALALAACGGASDEPVPSIATLYAPPDAGMVAWVDAQQASAYAREWLDALQGDAGGLLEMLDLDEALDEMEEEQGFEFAGVSEVMAFANAELDGGAVVIGGGFADDFLQSVRTLAEGVEFEETTYRGAAMIESSGFFGIGAFAAAVVWDGDNGDGPERNIVGTSDEVRAAIDRRADSREGNAVADVDSPALDALREIGGGWVRFAMAVPADAFADLTDAMTDALPDGYGEMFAGVDVGALSGLTLAGFAANRDDDGGERWTLRLEYGEAGDAERARSFAEGAIAMSKALTPAGASLDVLEAMEVSLDGTAVTVVSEATAEQIEALRAESVEALMDQMGILGTAL